MSRNALGLSQLEEVQLKTICEYLFFDQFREYASFPRFEQCFQPLFNEANLPLDSIYKEICGPKKKYINYPRLVNAYLKYKSQHNISNNLKFFFYRLLNEILMTDNWTKGESPEICFRYSTKISNSKRGFLSLIEVLTDIEGVIHGLNIEYDGSGFYNKVNSVIGHIRLCHFGYPACCSQAVRLVWWLCMRRGCSYRWRYHTRRDAGHHTFLDD